MAKRSLDQLIGLVGGVIGIIIGAVDMLIYKITGSAGFLSGSEAIILFSIIGLFGAFIVTSRKKDGSMIMIIIGLAGLIALSNYISWVPFALLLVAGLISRL